jgi:hypothetical protein
MEWFFLITIVALLWFWWDATAAREIAIRRAKELCQQSKVEFLDESVALSRLKLRRNPAGTITFARRFDFEFCTDGQQRYAGYVEMLGKVIQHIHMDAYRFDDYS